jgi:hypothetical protein
MVPKLNLGIDEGNRKTSLIVSWALKYNSSFWNSTFCNHTISKDVTMQMQDLIEYL